MLRSSHVISLAVVLLALLLAVSPLTGCAAASEPSPNADSGSSSSSKTTSVDTGSSADDVHAPANGNADAWGDVVYARRGSGGYLSGNPIVVRSTDELTAIDVADSQYVDGAHKSIEAASPQELFDEGFFATHDIVCAPFEAGSSAYVVSVGEVLPKDDGTYEVTFEVDKPDGMVTADMAYWLAFIPVDKH